MSRKHNTRHPDRGRSRYPLRLEKRGLSRAPAMPSLDSLRKIQERRTEEQGYPWRTASEEAMSGAVDQ